MAIMEALGLEPGVLIAQLIGLLVLFFAFKYLIGDKLQTSIEERRDLIKKLADADDEYKRILAEAKQKADAIFDKAETDKVRLVDEGKELAKKKQQEILAETTRESEVLLEHAKQRAEKLSKNLEQDFESSVKTTAFSVIKKLFNNKDTGLKDHYVVEVVKGFKA